MARGRRKNGEGCFSKTATAMITGFPILIIQENANINTFGQNQKMNVLQRLINGEMSKRAYILMMLMHIGLSHNGQIVGLIILLQVMLKLLQLVMTEAF